MVFRTLLTATSLCLLLAMPGTSKAENENMDRLDTYNVVWTTPSQDSKGAMPIGNGDIGLNVWVEKTGDLLFYIGKTDAWDENLRLLKLGLVRVRISPALDTGNGFRQELALRSGAIYVHTRHVSIRIWVDANHPVIHVDAKTLDAKPIEASASFEVWRKEKRPLTSEGGCEHHSTGFTSLPSFSYPDTVLAATPKRIGWYHRNQVSPWLPSLKLQKLDALAQTEIDPLLNRTSGAIICGDNFVAASDTEIRTLKPANAFSLSIHPLAQITDTAAQWVSAVEKQADEAGKISLEECWQKHQKWWGEFWSRSWIYVEAIKNTFALPLSTQPWRVGVDSNGHSNFAGTIVDPQVFDRALTSDEIANLAAKPRTDTATPAGANLTLTDGCTVSAWIKPAANEVGRILDRCTAGKPDGLVFDTYPGLSLRWIVGNHIIQNSGCLKANEWQHVAATVDTCGGARKIYLNGKLMGEEGEDEGKTVTQAYMLQRWINACGGRGAYPIKFNGSIFVVDHCNAERNFDADFRMWGGGYWFQNTRLTYWSMLDAGDYDLMLPFFEMYLRALPARKLATKTYYGHDGAFYPETMSFWGNYLDENYGIDRTGKPDGLTDNTYIRRYWQGNLEMIAMMLDYFDHTQNVSFCDRTLLPFAREILIFFDQHWKRGADGKILFEPAQSLETFHTATNPLPEIAGLRYVIPRLLGLPADEATKTAWRKTLADLPPVPTRTENGKIRLIPAEIYGAKANVENPELYAIFPYRLYTMAAGPEAVDIANNAWVVRSHTENRGWQQNAIQAALLGHATEARHYVLDSTSPSSTAPGFRFPAIWGPNYDWMPDQDHGTVMMSALQRMLIQYEGKKILLLPAWPKNWDVDFRLHAPNQTVIDGVYKNGKIVRIKVSPESREQDIIHMEAK